MDQRIGSWTSALTHEPAHWLMDQRIGSWTSALAHKPAHYLMNQRIGEQQRELQHLSRRLRHPSRYLGDLSQRLDDQERRLNLAVRARFDRLKSRIERVRLTSPAALVQAGQSRLHHLSQSLTRSETAVRTTKTNQLEQLVTRLNAVNPLSTLERGYAIVSTSPDDHVITSASDVKPGDTIRARLEKGELTAEVKSIES